MSEGHAATKVILIFVACTATLGYGDVLAHAATEGPVWVFGPSTAEVYIGISVISAGELPPPL